MKMSIEVIWMRLCDGFHSVDGFLKLLKFQIGVSHHQSGVDSSVWIGIGGSELLPDDCGFIQKAVPVQGLRFFK